MQVKVLVFWLLLSVPALAQSSDTPKILTFNQADTEHCKVIVLYGKPMLQSAYNGTTVAVAMPENHGPLGFSVLVSISRQEKGEADVAPKKFSAVYSDPAHTRFQYFDISRKWNE